MSYELFDINNNALHYNDLQEKSIWCKDGEKLEEAFIRLHGEKLGLSINPEKKTNPYAPDLLNLRTKKLGDLKLQSTPFFKALSLYNIDPTYAVVFNLKDKQRYERNYPDLEIYYWVYWLAVRFKMGNTEINVLPLNGVWKVDFPLLNVHINNCPIHQYQKRVHDTRGNAKSSYVCDIRNELFIRVI